MITHNLPFHHPWICERCHWQASYPMPDFSLRHLIRHCHKLVQPATRRYLRPLCHTLLATHCPNGLKINITEFLIHRDTITELPPSEAFPIRATSARNTNTSLCQKKKGFPLCKEKTRLSATCWALDMRKRQKTGNMDHLSASSLYGRMECIRSDHDHPSFLNVAGFGRLHPFY